jgi:ABC-type amino acid transport substrate-binding protein
MKRIALIFSVISIALLSDGRPVSACGDKLLVLGRGVRFQSDVPLQPASILLYRLDNPGLKSVLNDAGHKLQSAENRQDLEAALKTGKYDILMVRLPDASGVEALAASAPSKPIVLPLVFKGAKTEVALAEKQYGCVVKAPNRTGHYLATVDKAMNLKSKRDGAKPKLVASK